MQPPPLPRPAMLRIIARPRRRAADGRLLRPASHRAHDVRVREDLFPPRALFALGMRREIKLSSSANATMSYDFSKPKIDAMMMLPPAVCRPTSAAPVSRRELPRLRRDDASSIKRLR